MITHQRRGVALLIALLALVLIGALVSATLFRVQHDVRLAREGMARRRAEVAAERVLRLALATTSSASLRAYPIGATRTSTDVTNGVTTLLTVVRTDSTLAWLVAASTLPATRGIVRAQLGVSALIAPLGSASLQILPGDAWAQVY